LYSLLLRQQIIPERFETRLAQQPAEDVPGNVQGEKLEDYVIYLLYEELTLTA